MALGRLQSWELTQLVELSNGKRVDSQAFYILAIVVCSLYIFFLMVIEHYY